MRERENPCPQVAGPFERVGIELACPHVQDCDWANKAHKSPKERGDKRAKGKAKASHAKNSMPLSDFYRKECVFLGGGVVGCCVWFGASPCYYADLVFKEQNKTLASQRGIVPILISL